MIKAIETDYAGHRFRSRLEARWAVFFDALGIEWEYESQGYELSTGRRYLPDFLLTECGTWVEVKGSDRQLDRELVLTAAQELPEIEGDAEPGPRLLLLGPIPRPRVEGDWGWTALGPDQDEWVPGQLRYGFGSFDKNRRPWFLDNAQHKWRPGGLWTKPLWDREERGVPAAYTKARSARFEHGERG